MARDITVTFDDGTTHIYANAPDDITPNAVQTRAEKEFGKSVTHLDGGKSASTTNPLIDYNAVIGAPEAVLNLGTGLGASVVAGYRGLYDLARGESPEQAAQNVQKTQQTLTYQPRTKIGQVISEYNPLALVSKGITYAGEKAGGLTQKAATAAGLSPEVSAGLATGVDVGTQVLGNYLTGKTATSVGKAAKTKVLETEQKQAANVVKDKIWQDSRSAGFVVPKSAVSPTAATTALEGYAGKTATTEKAMVKNQETTNNLIRQEFNIPKDTPLSSELFAQLREDAGKAYADVQNLPLQQIDVLNPNTGLMQPKQFNPKQMVDDLRQSRNDARSYWDAYKKNGDPEYQKKAQAAENKATKLENDLDEVVKQSGNPDLMNSLRAARTEIAKLHQVENSFNPSSQNVDPAYFARLVQKNAPLTGNLKLVGDFANQFPRYVKETSKLASPGSSSVNSLGAAALSAFGNLKTAGMVAARGPVGSLMLSGPYQNMLVKPTYGPNMLVRGAANLSDVSPSSIAAANFLLSQQQGQQ